MEAVTDRRTTRSGKEGEAEAACGCK